MKSIILPLLFISISVFSQKTEPKIIIKTSNEKNIFYDEQPNVLFLSIEQGNDGYNDYMYNKLNALSLVKKVEKKKKDALNYFSIEFNQPLTVESAKMFFQSMSIKCFYTTLMKKIYVEDLLTEEEILSRKNTKMQYFQTNEKCGDPQYIDYYNYNIFNIEAKMQSMYNNDYIKNLFNGNVADLRDRYKNALQKRNEFIKNIK